MGPLTVCSTKVVVQHTLLLLVGLKGFLAHCFLLRTAENAVTKGWTGETLERAAHCTGWRGGRRPGEDREGGEQEERWACALHPNNTTQTHLYTLTSKQNTNCTPFPATPGSRLSTLLQAKLITLIVIL